MYIHRLLDFLSFSQANERQMSEEIQNAALVAPRSIMISIFINGALGFAVLLVTLFSLNNVEKALKTPTGYPYMQVFRTSFRSPYFFFKSRS